MKKKIMFVVSLLFGLVFINAGLNKFFNYMPIPEDLPENMVKLMSALMEVSWLIPLVAFAEILGGLLFAIPKTRILGALVIFPVIIGILLTNINSAPSGLPIAFILLAINLWIIYENREKLSLLIR
ncbi:MULTISPECIES: DoxX family membrane protein [Arenibacter]|uniref:DoxX family membrane protein n=1 Tax=Arenibacter TaxID=178469 RepID=UPI0004DFA3C0|nr:MULTISPECIES: DoxX family membrane protein [Arenibacter]GBF19075.1 doxX protein [Arenibacter sp. NBRC 103722]